MNYCVRHRIIIAAWLSGWTLGLAAQGENLNTIGDAPHLCAYLVAGLLIAVFVMIFSNRVYHYREQAVINGAKELNTQLALVLASNKTVVWTYDSIRNVYTILTNHGQTKEDYVPHKFAKFFFGNDFGSLRMVMDTIFSGEKESDVITLRSRREFDDTEERLFRIHVRVLEKSGSGRVRRLIGVGRDVTEETARREAAERNGLMFHTVFNSSLADMIFYDADGILTELNDKAMETFHVTDREALLARRVNIHDIPSYRNIDIGHLDGSIQISSITDIGKVKQTDERIPEVAMGGKFYYEVNVCPIRSRDGGSGRLRGVMAAGRDITEMVESHHRQQHDSLLLKETTKEIERYINNINYTLKVSGVRLVNYFPDTHELHILSDLNNTQYLLSQIRCVSLLHESDRRKARGLLMRMDERRAEGFSVTLHSRLRDEQRRDIYLGFSFIPIKGEDGMTRHYTGLLRNETEMVYTEKRLREETRKAQETEELKNTFLLNMSYEIRTPLNAVLGFAELFDGPHDEADEPVFAEEIRRNTGDLLTLINDILFISRLDARMVELNYAECDFAQLFDGYCYMGWSQLQPKVEVSVENPYNRLIVSIDSQNLGEVIRKLCENAARFTSEGTIRAKYEYRHGELNISIEDSGKGVSDAMLPHVFDRFVRNEFNERNGTGLDLPIVKELVEQMGGSIEVQSEVGKGSIVYVIIPCEMSEMVKK